MFSVTSPNLVPYIRASEFRESWIVLDVIVIAAASFYSIPFDYFGETTDIYLNVLIMYKRVLIIISLSY